jgi:hypothetical protein
MHQGVNMIKRGKSENVNVKQTNTFKDDSEEKFQKMLKELKQVNDKLTSESKNIDNNLKLLAHSTKKSAELLLIKKRLYR